ncbi:PAS domain S-box protein [Anabaena sp. UHCC 0204]|uniref:PAS domain S-box protein n=1 Tax=Anabaena sp. UHCC 0204 TaxID=2590009 RepID=UPI0014487639|nr:PAS domain S-box protein [Anabaena sp. UHCC 0204]MTJ10211.1 PAS domain S-box protein [Anabaena sp. UHCC 0204]
MIVGNNQPILILMLFIAAVIAAYTSINLVERLSAELLPKWRSLWICTSIITMASCIWLMHFIAMLTLQQPLLITDNITTLSWIEVIIAFGIAILLNKLFTFKLSEQKALKASENRFFLALEGTNVGIWDWEIDTGKIYFSPRWKSILGYEDQELPNTIETWQQSLHPEDKEQVMSVLNQYLENKIPIYEIEFRARHKDGSYRWIFARGVSLRDQKGIPYRLSGSHADITEHKQLAQELQESRQFLTSIIENIPLALNVQDVKKDYRFVIWNQTCEHIFGLKSKDTINHNVNELLTTQKSDIFLSPLLETLNHNQELQTSEETVNSYFQGKMLLRTLKVPISNQGEITHILSISDDITSRRQIESALQESAEREKALAKAIQRMRQTLDMKTIFTATTSELRQVIHCDRVVVYRFRSDWSGEFIAESVGSDWISLWDEQNNNPKFQENALANERCTVKDFDSNAKDDNIEDDLNLVKDTYLQRTKGGVYSQGVTYRVIEDIYEANFDTCYLQLLEQFQARAYIIVPIFYSNKIWGLLAIYQNSHPRHWKEAEIKIVVQIANQLGVALQQAELLEQTQKQSIALQNALIAADAASHAKSEFLANMSHELRTPLNAILGFTQVMSRDTKLSNEHQENLKIINRAGEHLLTIINDILEMSKIEAGKTTLNKHSFNFHDFLNVLYNFIKLRAESKGLELKFDYAPDIPAYTYGDEGKIRQVLLNLLGNAIKFTEKGRVNLQVKQNWIMEYGENNPVYKKLTFEVSDTGFGISPEEIKLLFQSFKQTEIGRKYQQGTGLGLAISRKYVELMGGNIQVNSQLGVGSTFTFDVTIEESAASNVKIPLIGEKVISIAPHQSEYIILVAEDIPDSRLLLVKLLKEIGFTVYEAENGEEAVNCWRTWQPHLIIMDIQMPITDGLTATKIIKNTPQGKNTKILALTASIFEENRQAILAAGCDDFLSKPLHVPALLEQISEHLGVEYVYENVSPDIASAPVQKMSEAEVIAMLLTMPRAWLTQLNQAAAQCNDDKVLKLINQIAPENNSFANFIKDLALDFQFKKIMELMPEKL